MWQLPQLKNNDLLLHLLIIYAISGEEMSQPLDVLRPLFPLNSSIRPRADIPACCQYVVTFKIILHYLHSDTKVIGKFLRK